MLGQTALPQSLRRPRESDRRDGAGEGRAPARGRPARLARPDRLRARPGRRGPDPVLDRRDEGARRRGADARRRPPQTSRTRRRPTPSASSPSSPATCNLIFVQARSAELVDDGARPGRPSSCSGAPSDPAGHAAGLRRPQPQPDHAGARGQQPDHGAAARRGRLDLADRRRHRHHEHPARLGHRAHARDRDPHGDRRAPRPRAPAVPRRGGAAERDRRRGRHRRGHHALGADLVRRRAGRRCSRRSRSPAASSSPPPWASSSATTRRAALRSSIRSKRCGTSDAGRCGNRDADRAARGLRGRPELRAAGGAEPPGLHGGADAGGADTPQPARASSASNSPGRSRRNGGRHSARPNSTT